jgi:hypothetical protein
VQPIANNDVNNATASPPQFSPIERETETSFNDALASFPPQSDCTAYPGSPSQSGAPSGRLPADVDGNGNAGGAGCASPQSPSGWAPSGRLPAGVDGNGNAGGAGCASPQSPSGWAPSGRLPAGVGGNAGGAGCAPPDPGCTDPSTGSGWPAGGSASWSPRLGPGPEIPPGKGSIPGTAPPLTGNVAQDLNTLAGMVNNPGTSNQALQTFAHQVESEAERAGNLPAANQAFQLAAGFGGGTGAPASGGASAPQPSWPTTAPPSTAPSTFPGSAVPPPLAGAPATGGTSVLPPPPAGSSGNYESDISRAAALAPAAQNGFPAANTDTDPSTRASLYTQDERDYELDAADFAQAARDAPNNVARDDATEEVAQFKNGAAETMFASGQAGPGGAQHAVYDALMAQAQSLFSSAANDPNNPRSSVDKQKAIDVATMQGQTDAGLGDSATYQSANQDVTSNELSAAQLESAGTPAPAAE